MLLSIEWLCRSLSFNEKNRLKIEVIFSFSNVLLIIIPHIRTSLGEGGGQQPLNLLTVN